MKTFVPILRSRKIFTLLFLLISAASLVKGQDSTLNFQNPVLQSGTALQVGAKYLFSGVQNNVDAVVSIDSLINGAQINKIDDNSNGVGYKEAFQPAVQSGGVIGMSYAVFTIRFYEQGTTIPKMVPSVNATALDLDGNNALKEFARINVGSGGIMNYLVTTPDISVTQVVSGDFMGQNILGIERSGIDTSALANMFTARNSAISSFTIKYGAITTNPSNAVRQYSLYMKGFNYPVNTLPVKLTSFTATLNNNSKVDLKWTTASEINVSHFAVEKSLDGIDYTEAGLVFAYGSVNDNTNYSFADNLGNTSATVIYYRLRSVDMDGKAEYSETRMIRIGKGKENTISILAYPNPVVSELRITIPATWQNKAVTYQVYSINGQVVNSKQTGSSSQTETINVSKLAPGMYIIKAICGSETTQERIVKQ